MAAAGRSWVITVPAAAEGERNEDLGLLSLAVLDLQLSPRELGLLYPPRALFAVTRAPP